MKAPLAKLGRRTHADLKRAVMKAVNMLPGVYVFPAGSGALHAGGRFIRFGMVGVSDLVGWRERIVHDATVCTDLKCDAHRISLPRFVALEIKIGKDRLSVEQKAFLDKVREAGGIAVEVRSVEDAVKALQ